MKQLVCRIFGHRAEATLVKSVFETTGESLLRYRCARCNRQINVVTDEVVDWKPFD